ncbi:uncharacterized protein [Triticum aestivum]|uniref:uncharacterized protein n=1 Tax=Triticum aestivum TaxID=4565 RepID=UPI001D01B105|nr:uncharacterized protein LOC123183463 [Triticum aestivum]
MGGGGGGGRDGHWGRAKAHGRLRGRTTLDRVSSRRRRRGHGRAREQCTVYEARAGHDAGHGARPRGRAARAVAGRGGRRPERQRQQAGHALGVMERLGGRDAAGRSRGKRVRKAGDRALDLANRFRRAYKLGPSSRGLPTATRALPAASAASSPRHHHATMSPRRRGSSGYRGVRERPSGAYYAKIRSGNVRHGLGTFENAHQAARAYDAAAWRLESPCGQMNFHDVYTREQTQAVAPLPRLTTDQDREEHHRQERCLLIAEEDERATEKWRRRHPEDVANENAFWAERTARRRVEWADRRRRKALAISQCDPVNAGGKSFFSSDDDRWDDVWLDTSDKTSLDDDVDDSE